MRTRLPNIGVSWKDCNSLLKNFNRYSLEEEEGEGVVMVEGGIRKGKGNGKGKRSLFEMTVCELEYEVVTNDMKIKFTTQYQ